MEESEGESAEKAAELITRMDAVVKEQKLLSGSEKQFGIYQITARDPEHDYRFMNLDFVKRHGMEVNCADYELVYTEPLTEKDTLEAIYERFNIQRLADFTGHSLSVSDVVVLNDGSTVKAYYVDSIGFAELPEFFKERNIDLQKENLLNEELQEIEIFDKPGLFSNGRLRDEDVPDGLYRYDLRGSDYDPGQPITVEKTVVVNHAASVLMAEELDLGAEAVSYTHLAVERADWVDLGETPEGYSINQYFAQHPEMVLGEITTESTQYGKQETTVKPIEGADLAQQLKEAVGNIQATITEPEISDDELDLQEEPIPADPNVKNFSFTNVDGQIYYRENSFMNKVELPAVTAERVLGMIALRETTRKLLDCQLHDGSDAEVQLLQNELKQQYTAFKAQYGLINSTANKRTFRQDSSYCLLASLEILDEEKNLKRLADIFTKRTIRKPEPVTSVDTPSEALALSIGEKAKVDVPFMVQLCGKTEQEITDELAGAIFRNPVTQQWETSDEYLSGNVREKLATAETFVSNHAEYQINVDYLKRVQPKDLDASEIEVRLGANWVKPEYITQFMKEVFKTPNYYAGIDIKATYSEISGAWNISGKSLDRGKDVYKRQSDAR